MRSKLRFSSQLIAILVLVLTAAMSRLLPHPPNFTPLGAMALLGAATLRSFPQALLLPLAALYLSDLVLNNVVYAEYQSGFTWAVNTGTYLGFLAVVLLGWYFLRDRGMEAKRIFTVTLAGTFLFYLLTNFLVWYSDPMQLYPNHLGGLGMSYVAALPFLLNSLLGDLFYTALLFGAYSWYQAKAVASA